ncbi:peptidoglycan DD-metalloendopeptidase family protein [Nocardioides coralli]|uniref:peptidoglycan DD-metalloendopeptidase family protein n=1 Tax=Nocardioides coralli TaxID=2872154 RepID=UPI0020176195|nr:peptidoglycan DD-metalloendopeptidase family protein [Nocardioides coralli]
MRSTALAVAVLVAVTATPAAYAVPDPVGEWPLSPTPEVVAGFDPPESTWGAGHRGVDLLGTPGQRVRAALPGTVSFVGMIAGRGVVTVDHGATRTTYEPVAATLERGTAVPAGGVVGILELPGSHCFPRACLHWGWIRGTTYLDPLKLVGGGPVRLLPLDGLPAGAERDPGPTVESLYVTWRPLAHLLRPGVLR